MAILETDKTNLKLDNNNDIVISKGQIQQVSGGDGVAQAARTRLKLFKGEWFFDLEAGMPYFQEIFIKNPSFTLIKNKVREILISVPGIDVQENIVSIDLAFDGADRELTITWRAATAFGVISDSVSPPTT